MACTFSSVMLLAYLLVCWYPQIAATDISLQEEWLRQLYKSTNGHHWFKNENWNSPQSVCDWYGVSCDDNQEIHTIQLESNNLTGTLPQFSVISSLRIINVRHNDLQGEVPAVDVLPRLKYLFADGNNKLVGTIPNDNFIGVRLPPWLFSIIITMYLCVCLLVVGWAFLL
eukprot:TRINITY_DN53266_c0_g1_i1.p1 TRINITY_DN53266_c0_g1~~TRINITY_DN53266_c0_g1_i1.p1  ORF type:complete len:170 (-),score=21.89 TRINITY_DN53266_c0_g1_i1:128-637(-)